MEGFDGGRGFVGVGGEAELVEGDFAASVNGRRILRIVERGVAVVIAGKIGVMVRLVGEHDEGNFPFGGLQLGDADFGYGELADGGNGKALAQPQRFKRRNGVGLFQLQRCRFKEPPLSFGQPQPIVVCQVQVPLVPHAAGLMLILNAAGHFARLAVKSAFCP